MGKTIYGERNKNSGLSGGMTRGAGYLPGRGMMDLSGVMKLLCVDRYEDGLHGYVQLSRLFKLWLENSPFHCM